MFQFTRPRGARRRRGASIRGGTARFNSRAHVGRDPPGVPLPLPPHRGFNSRAHVGRDPGTAQAVAFVDVFQFTRPRGARPPAPTPQSRHGSVSIHAPTWGATRAIIAAHPAIAVSIHAPTWGATRGPSATRASTRGFNSRAHVGRDWRGRACRSRGRSFNSRAHVGRDHGRRALRVPGRFQFTRPRGARRAALPCSKHTRGFNSRAHVGRDEPDADLDLRPLVSIHAPTWGATEYAAFLDKFKPFQFTRPRGARPSAR